jgi:hypothetical protein
MFLLRPESGHSVGAGKPLASSGEITAGQPIQPARRPGEPMEEYDGATFSCEMALREWLLLFVDYIATKHGMYEVLNSIVGGTSDLYSRLRRR